MGQKLEFDWQEIGRVERDNKGLLVFPEVSDEPGLIRFLINASPDDVYIGESSNLRQRVLMQFRARHRESTNVRIREALNRHIDAGRAVRVSVIYQADVTTDLSNKRARLDMKRLLIDDAEASGQHLLNR